MFITLIALTIVLGTGFLVLGHLRDIARDTASIVVQSTARARSAGLVLQRISFFSLWALIFALSFY